MKDKEGKPILVTASDTCFNQWHQIHDLTKLSQYKYRKIKNKKKRSKQKKRKLNDTLVSTEEQTTNNQASLDKAKTNRKRSVKKFSPTFYSIN